MGQPPPTQGSWPWLHYVTRGIRRSHAGVPKRIRLPISKEIMLKLREVWSSLTDTFTARMLWAAACLGFFGFMRCGEFCHSASESSLMLSDIAVDSHVNPTVVRVLLRKAKNDPFGKGVNIFLGRVEGSSLCPVAAVLQFLALRSSSLFIHENGSPLSRSTFVGKVKEALAAASIPQQNYSGHSFRIGAATSAAAAGVPDHVIKLLGRWNSEAYSLYIRTPRESLASISSRLA